jgi:GNAT superfamily N-acetyltransferase
MAWTLRKATPKDLPLLVRHRDAMWLEMGRVAPGEHDPTSKAYGKWLRARMKLGTLTAFIAQEERPDGKTGAVLASGAVWIQDVQPRPGHPLTMWGYILSVYTEPEARRQGLARAIVDACIEHAKAAGCTRCCLHASKEGRPLYTQLGFEPTEEMWLDLRPHDQRPQARKQARLARTRAAGRPIGLHRHP